MAETLSCGSTTKRQAHGHAFIPPTGSVMTDTINRMDSQVPARLPLWPTVGRAYALWVRNLPELVRISWLWLLLTGAVVAVLLSATLPEGVVADFVSDMVMLPASASVAIAWHRLLLTDERVGRGTYLRFDRTVVGYSVLVFLILMLPSYVHWSVKGLIGTGDGGTLTLPWLIMWLLVCFYSTRLTLALPAMALGRRDVTLGTAWRIGRHNTWRLAVGYFLCTVPWIVALVGLTTWIDSVLGSNVVAALDQMLDLAEIPCGMISVSFLSLAYRHFFEEATVG
jgi:hypothetical protein